MLIVSYLTLFSYLNLRRLNLRRQPPLVKLRHTFIKYCATFC